VCAGKLPALLGFRVERGGRVRLTASIILLASFGAAFGQSRDSFVDVSDIQDVFVTPSNSGLTYTASVGPAPKFVLNSISYNIIDVFGFWVLKNEDPDLLAPKNSDFGVWRVMNNTASNGEIAGWKTNSNTGLVPGQSEVFNFVSLNAAEVDQYGFHVRLDGIFPGTQGNTGFITVPEPGTLAALAVGALALFRRRRN